MGMIFGGSLEEKRRCLDSAGNPIKENTFYSCLGNIIYVGSDSKGGLLYSTAQGDKTPLPTTISTHFDPIGNPKEELEVMRTKASWMEKILKEQSKSKPGA
ncbi:MAG: hypothetical protein ABIB79_02395 [archaeon]